MERTGAGEKGRRSFSPLLAFLAFPLPAFRLRLSFYRFHASVGRFQRLNGLVPRASGFVVRPSDCVARRCRGDAPGPILA